MDKNNIETINFLGIKIAAVTTDEIIDRILELAIYGKRKMIAYVNAHCINASFSDNEYREILKQADLVYAGGKGVVWASKLFPQSLPERVNILDFFDKLAKRLIKNNITLYLLGGKPEVVKKAVCELKKRFSGLSILGFHHGFFKPEMEADIIKEINMLKPHILLVGMGVPKQEKWINKYLNQLDVNLCWAVGAVFSNFSGIFTRAPNWMIKCGLEWLYRLFQEPKRLWRRYLIGNFVFVYRVLKRYVENLR